MNSRCSSMLNYHHLIAKLSDEDIRKILDKHFKEEKSKKTRNDTIVLGTNITKTKNKKNSRKLLSRFFDCFSH